MGEPKLQWSFSKLINYAEPQGNWLRVRGWVRRFLAYSGVHHYELGGWIYQDHLAPDSEQGKSPLLARKDPYLISVAKVWGSDARGEIAVGRPHRGGIQEPLPWNELAFLPCAVMREQAA